MFGLKWGGGGKTPEFPVEFDDDDMEIVQHIIDKKLSMVGRERLFATLMAARHVARNDIEGAVAPFPECGPGTEADTALGCQTLPQSCQ